LHSGAPLDICAFKEEERFGKFGHFWLFSPNKTEQFRVLRWTNPEESDSRKEL